ncbi:Ethanolamine utilization cobalamin adenosyltransferase [uncultured Clostridium sp.]|nr:Ethanolamine utilization cobalamin adenosyltransferase [uncultured Clostridium sp.]
MKFITEEYLRDLFKKEPFNNFKLNQGERLTPGASQYLSDKGIRMVDEVSFKKSNKPIVSEEKVADLGNYDLKKKLCRKLKSMEAVFLVTSSEIFDEDILMSQKVIELGKKIYSIRNFIEGKGKLENSCLQECSGINSNNFYKDIDDCFEINEFHMQFEKSKVIFKLHALRCSLREIELLVLEAFVESEENNKLIDEIIKSINSVINTLSQMICTTIGGKRCQRRI